MLKDAKGPFSPSSFRFLSSFVLFVSLSFLLGFAFVDSTNAEKPQLVTFQSDRPALSDFGCGQAIRATPIKIPSAYEALALLEDVSIRLEDFYHPHMESKFFVTFNQMVKAKITTKNPKKKKPPISFTLHFIKHSTHL